MITRLPLETQTLYVELLEHLLAGEAERSVGNAKGSFTEKSVSGETYVYFQASQPGGSTKQFYLGRKSPALERLRRSFARARADLLPDRERVHRLAAQLRAGGATTTDASSNRVIAALADAGVFTAGGILVGTHAFVVLGNLLGVRFAPGGLRTQDVDVARARENDVDVAVPDLRADIPTVLESLKMGFLPVPALETSHASTSFKVRGQALRLDLLCPKKGEQRAHKEGRRDDPVYIPRLAASAQPLDYLDYLIESPERAVLLGAKGTLVYVPTPARFAFHKLLVAQLRPAAFENKSRKDLAQAAALFEVLLEDRPGDIVLAWNSLRRRGKRWQQLARRGIDRLARDGSGLHAHLRAAVGVAPRGSG